MKAPSIVRWTLLGLLFASPIATQIANATTFAELSVEQFTDASKLIVEGTVTKVTTEYLADRDLVVTRATLTVDVVHKGEAPAEITITSIGGFTAEHATEIEGRAQFAVDEPIFIFLHQTEEGWFVPVSKFLGKYTLRRAPGERENYLRRWHGMRQDNGKFDYRFLPHPEKSKRTYIGTMRDQVQQHLHDGWDGKAIPGITTETLQQLNKRSQP